MIQSINPYNGEILSEFEFYTDKEILNAIEDASSAYKYWRRSKYENRHELLQNVANLLKSNKQYYAELITREMGKPIDQSYAEIEKCAAMTSFYAERFDDFLQHQIIETKHSRSFVAYEPLGIVFSIMPWNFPFWQALRCAVPTIAAGNCYMLKHALNVSLCAIELQKLFLQAGFNKGIFTTIFADIPQISSIISHNAIVGVSLTGSEKAGMSVATIAGQNLKKCVLELGGNDPCIIFEDANLEKATFAAVRSRMNNSGQTCIAAKRIFLQQTIYENALEKLSSLIQGLKVGNPMENGTDIGPLARPDLRITLDKQVEQSIKNGANSIIAAGSISSDYCFFKPGLYDNIQKGQAFENEEIFGPVMTVFPFEDVEDVILMANDSRYGLGASIWTQDFERAEYIGAHIDVGTIAINNIVRSDMQLPFGGVKKSGYGRELGEMGIREFTNVKTYFLE